MPEGGWTKPLRAGLWLLAALWLVLALPTAAWSQAHIVSHEWQLDPAGQRTLSEAQSGPWQPAPELLSLGYTPQVLWVRLTVRATGSDEPLVLRIRPSYLDHVRLYQPDPGQAGQWRARDTGDTLPFSTRDRASSALGFLWQPPGPGEHTLYLRVATTSTLMFHLEALDPREAQFRESRGDGFMVFYLSVMLCMGLWALLDYALLRHSVNLWFMAAQFNSIVVALSVLGYMARMLPDHWSAIGHWTTGVTVCLSTMLYMGFYRSMLADNEPSPASRRAMAVAMLLFPLQLLAMATGHHRLAVQSNAIMGLSAALPLLILMVATARKDGLLTRRAWWVVCGIQTVLSLATMLPLLGWRNVSLFNMQAPLFVGMSSALLMMTVLMLRSARTIQAAREDRLRFDLMAQRLTLEQQQRADQRQFLDMLGHELKTPLMTIRLANHALLQLLPGAEPAAVRRLERIEASATAMGQVLERVMQANRLDDANLPVTPSHIDLAALLHDLRSTMAEPERLHTLGDLSLRPYTDPDQLRVIVANLLDNACKYSPPGSPVTLDVRPQADHWQLSVRNQVGPAGAPDPDRVFRKYHRAEEVRGSAGAGLGLWLGHNLAQRLGGSLSALTTDDHVEFSLCLPLSTPP